MDVVAACTQDNIGGEKGVVRSKSRLVQGQTRPTAALTGRVPRHWFSRLDYAPVRDADDRAGCSADPRLAEKSDNFGRGHCERDSLAGLIGGHPAGFPTDATGTTSSAHVQQWPDDRFSRAQLHEQLWQPFGAMRPLAVRKHGEDKLIWRRGAALSEGPDSPNPRFLKMFGKHCCRPTVDVEPHLCVLERAQSPLGLPYPDQAVQLPSYLLRGRRPMWWMLGEHALSGKKSDCGRDGIKRDFQFAGQLGLTRSSP
ncbi:hypothetical protein GCM10009765_82010 [Fodinicola feengrottensis]|uniref:Uncharacterized protein n=1 Tax=Fodinicola feengrottensis TaxID=435914 RepID=A0ABP4VF88_9ACTN